MKAFLKMKPHKIGDGYDLTMKAGSVLNEIGKKKEAIDFHQEACTNGYDFFKVLKLLKKFGLT